MVKRVNRFDVHWVSLDFTTVGSETHKPRPGLIISPETMNLELPAVIIAPMTGTVRSTFLYRVKTKFNGEEQHIMLDQIRTVDKERLGKRIGEIDDKTASEVSKILNEMLCT